MAGRRGIERRSQSGRSRSGPLRGMRRLFVDTAGWMACADRNDVAHRKCTAVRDAELRVGRLLLTTDYVVDETLTLLRLRLGLRAAREWWERISGSPRLIVMSSDGEIREQALQWFFRYADKEFSFTDCTSFAVMKAEKIRDALTTDRHFEQAGFRMVP
ncbi:MAG: type II toxin-antitoxin system VapC family toxin [Chthoniobacterales bacterium]|nr:type II toxin-antitoxin system VapC family toxin [Chthoniobacterales bacterium]